MDISENLLRDADTPTSVFFVDESGSKGSGDRFFVAGAVKVRNPGSLLRDIQAIREHHGFTNEFKFHKVGKNTIRIFCDLIDVLKAADTHIGAFVIDKRLRDPFTGSSQWDAHAGVIAQLIVGCTVMNEVTCALVDSVSTPKGIAVDEVIKAKVNAQLHGLSLVSVIALDSRSTDGLQLADIVAGSVFYQRRGQGNRPGSPKALVAGYLAAAFGIPDFRDTRTSRVNILTSRPKAKLRRRVEAPKVAMPTLRGPNGKFAAGKPSA